jgi:hypothetical protein
MTEPDRVDKSIKSHVVLGLVLSSHSPPGPVNPRVGDNLTATDDSFNGQSPTSTRQTYSKSDRARLP